MPDQQKLPDELPPWAAQKIARDGYPWVTPSQGRAVVTPTPGGANRVAAFYRECVRVLREGSANAE